MRASSSICGVMVIHKWWVEMGGAEWPNNDWLVLYLFACLTQFKAPKLGPIETRPCQGTLHLRSC